MFEIVKISELKCTMHMQPVSNNITKVTSQYHILQKHVNQFLNFQEQLLKPEFTYKYT